MVLETEKAGDAAEASLPLLLESAGAASKKPGKLLLLGTRVAVGAAYLGVGAYYLVVLVPMLQTLFWAYRKKREVLKRLK